MVPSPVYFLFSSFARCSSPHQQLGEQRQAHFRSFSPAHPQSQTTVPQTGLGILMSNSTAPQPVAAAPTLLAPHPSPQHPPPPQPAAPATTAPLNNPYAHLTPEQQSRIQEDLADRECQASALAAAGMVADSVSFTRPATSVGQVLQAPPPLVGIAPPPGHPPPPPTTDNGGSEVAMEGINWNMIDLGPGVDDIDMDFAAMFDPEQEQAFMDESITPASAPTQTQTTAYQQQPAATEEHGAPNPFNATPV